MKKIIFIVATILLFLGVAGYLVYEFIPEKNEVETEIINATDSEGFTVESVIAADKEYMKLNYPEYKTYKWFETCILMNDWLDAEVAPEIFGIADVFQIEKKVGRNTRCKVILISHNLQKDSIDVRNGFWVEDYDLNELDTLKFITFEQAYDIFNRANVKKPHSKHVVFRKAIGPNHDNTYNPQYIFGNADCHYYVDAVTGELNTVDPSGIPEEGGDDPYLVKD